MTSFGSGDPFPHRKVPPHSQKGIAIAVGLDGDGLRRSAMAAIQEGISGRYSSTRVHLRIVHDADERSNRIFAMRPSQAPRFSSRLGRPDGLPDCPGTNRPVSALLAGKLLLVVVVISPIEGPWSTVLLFGIGLLNFHWIGKSRGPHANG